MKKRNRWLNIEPRTTALLLGFGIGLGLAVHEVFFVVPLVVVLILVTEWTVENAHEFVRGFHPRPRIS